MMTMILMMKVMMLERRRRRIVTDSSDIVHGQPVPLVLPHPGLPEQSRNHFEWLVHICLFVLMVCAGYFLWLVHLCLFVSLCMQPLSVISSYLSLNGIILIEFSFVLFAWRAMLWIKITMTIFFCLWALSMVLRRAMLWMNCSILACIPQYRNSTCQKIKLKKKIKFKI